MVGKNEPTKTEEYHVGNIATETKQAIIGPNNEEVSVLELLTKIHNDLNELKKKMLG